MASRIRRRKLVRWRLPPHGTGSFKPASPTGAGVAFDETFRLGAVLQVLVEPITGAGFSRTLVQWLGRKFEPLAPILLPNAVVIVTDDPGSELRICGFTETTLLAPF